MVSVGVEEELVEDILHVARVMHKWWHSLVSRPWNFCCHVSATPAKILSQATPNQPQRGSPRACYWKRSTLGLVGSGLRDNCKNYTGDKGLSLLVSRSQTLTLWLREAMSLLHTYMHTRVLEFVLYCLQPQNQLVQVEPRLWQCCSCFWQGWCVPAHVYWTVDMVRLVTVVPFVSSLYSPVLPKCQGLWQSQGHLWKSC